MTEAEWLSCANSKAMLEFLRGKASDRKLRLFAVGYCRRIWHVLKDERSQRSIEMSERYADGESELKLMLDAGDHALEAIRDGSPEGPTAEWWKIAECTPISAYNAARMCAFSDAWKVADSASGTSYLPAHIDTRLGQCLAGLLRDIFNPFRPVSLDPSWLTSPVTMMAQSIYEEWAFDRLPILADALEDTGCTHAELLAHCRGPGPHVRGCWALDLLLGKE